MRKTAPQLACGRPRKGKKATEKNTMLESNQIVQQESINGKASDRATASASTRLADDAYQLAGREVSPQVVRHTAHNEGKWVALTFDDGPSPKYTPQVLDILKQYQIKATFCVIGDQVNEYPDLVRRIAADGHKLCDHTMTHDMHLPEKSDSRIKEEIVGNKETLQKVVPGSEVAYYRAPGGNWSGDVRQLAASWGLRPLGWSVDPRDWSRPGVDSILGTIREELKPGGVILMHDGGGNRTQTVAALQTLIPELKQQGYSFDFPQQ
jgi:peptidoglycan-N-acetylglucosamine deacetylase